MTGPIRKMTPDLEIQRATSSAGVPTDEQFIHWLQAIDPTVPDKASLAIRIVDEREARRFNFEYRGRDHATNVLSFPAELPPGLPAELAQSQLGDLLLCAPIVAREALEQGKPETDHWAHLVIHGILHLLGYQHEQCADAREMELLEKTILAKLGIANPYRDNG